VAPPSVVRLRESPELEYRVSGEPGRMASTVDSDGAFGAAPTSAQEAPASADRKIPRVPTTTGGTGVVPAKTMSGLEEEIESA
jgi:hypothetical protein